MTAVRTLARLSRLLEHAGTGLTLPQFRLLAMVTLGGERATALAGRLSLSKPTITAAVDGLVERGLVTREMVEGDRRAGKVEITAAGGRALADAEALMAERLGPIIDRCNDPAVVRSALEQLEHALDEVAAERR